MLISATKTKLVPYRKHCHFSLQFANQHFNLFNVFNLFQFCTYTMEPTQTKDTKIAKFQSKSLVSQNISYQAALGKRTDVKKNPLTLWFDHHGKQEIQCTKHVQQFKI